MPPRFNRTGRRDRGTGKVRQIGKTPNGDGIDVFFTVLNGGGQKAINSGYVQIKE